MTTFSPGPGAPSRAPRPVGSAVLGRGTPARAERAIGVRSGFAALARTVLIAVLLVGSTAGAPAAALRAGPDMTVRSVPGSSPTGYVAPVSGVDPPSGVERSFDPPEHEWGPGHRGVDLTAAVSADVVSPGPGVVTFAGPVARRGVVVVTHPDGLRSSLEPVTASVAVGTAVAAGTVIGTVEGDGAGDNVSANHCAPRSCVHWGVRRGERYIDPLTLLDRPPIVLLPDR
ncbi:murein hydrolase activator EnvC family protein [Promicromonospora sp. NPDC052451]|uniref:murein hydrolase activator EnvC family protein n=1 Tax=Promicromonospora sp. NPDC052451 TaxID=3364407 RepID=UPI0037C73746